MTKLLEMDSVTKLYGNVIGVNDISIALAPGAYGLLGPNGAGKSTLLNLITGQISPTIGGLRVMGLTPRNCDELYAQIGYCPADESMYTEVSARSWIAYLAKLHGMTPESATRETDRVLVQVGLREAMHRPIKTYSRGMRQRVKIAQALVHDPQFLLLDEPFSGLDPIGRNEITTLLNDWIAAGRSVIIASHVLHDIEALTRSFLLISGGRLLATGEASEIQEAFLNRPNDITMHSSQPQQLARQLLQTDLVDALSLSSDSVTLTTSQSGQLFAQIAHWQAEWDVDISEIHSGDESLSAIFQSLTRVQRGAFQR